MADTSEAQVYYAEESTWGTPASGTYNELRITGESLSKTTNTTTSEEIRSDRQVTDVQKTSITAEGDIDFELSFASFDDLLEGVMLNSFDGALNISGTDISVDGTNDEIDSTSTDFSSIEVGQWVEVRGFTNSENNGFFRIDSVATNTIGVQYANLVDESSGNNITIDGNRLVNGTTDKFYTIEKEFSDTGDFYRYPGSYISTLDLNIDSGSLVTGTFGVMAQTEEQNENQTGSSTSSANSNPIINATKNIEDEREGGSTGITINSLSISYDNSVRERPAVGQEESLQFGTGTIGLSGSIEAYFESDSLYQKYLDFNETDLSFRITDDDDAHYIITIPEAKYTDGSVEVTGQDDDVFSSLDFEAYKDNDGSGVTFQIDKFTA